MKHTDLREYLINDENSIGINRSSTSFFSVRSIYFRFQIFEHLGNKDILFFNKIIYFKVRDYMKLDKIDR
jgi:hypothetical protein